MVMSSPVVIELTPAERDLLLGWTSHPTAQNRQRIRAQIVLLAADGWANLQISRHLGCCQDTVRKWRGRFAVHRVKGLADQHRSGRPRKCTALQTAQVKAIACSRPADRGLPLARWSVSQITRQALAEGVIAAISRATVARYLRGQGRACARPVRALLAGPPAGRRRVRHLRRREARHSGPASTRRATHPARPSPPGRVRLSTRRHPGLLAALDVGSGHVIGHIDQTTGISPFTTLVDKVMIMEPYVSAKRVYWIVDNGSSHRGWTGSTTPTRTQP